VDEETQLVAREGEVPALIPAEELAAKVVKAIEVIAELLALETPHPATAHRVRSARTVPREFVVAMTDAVEALAELQRLKTFDSAEARDVLQASDSMKVVANRAAMFLASINYTIEARWARVAGAAMDTYRLASAMVTATDNPELAAHVATLRRHLGRKSGRKKKKPGAGEGK
jgi:hypothetical protein